MDGASLTAVDRFGRHLVYERMLSKHTCSAYAQDIAALVAFCDRGGIAQWGDLKAPDIRAFGARQHAGGCSAVTVHRRLAGVRCFLNFLIREGVLGFNAAVGIQAPRVKRLLPKVLDVDQVTQLLEH